MSILKKTIAITRTTPQQALQKRSDIDYKIKDLLVFSLAGKMVTQDAIRIIQEDKVQSAVNARMSPMLIAKLTKLSKEVEKWGEEMTSIRSILLDLNKEKSAADRNASLYWLDFDGYICKGYLEIISYLHNMHPQQFIFFLSEIFKLSTAAAEHQRYTPYTDKQLVIEQQLELPKSLHRTVKEKLDIEDIADITTRFFQEYNIAKHQTLTMDGSFPGKLYQWSLTDVEADTKTSVKLHKKDGRIILTVDNADETQSLCIGNWTAGRIHQQLGLLFEVSVSFNHLIP